MRTLKPTRWLIPASFFLALVGGQGLAAAAPSARRADLASFTLHIHDVAPLRDPGEACPASAESDLVRPLAWADVPVLRSLRFAVLRAHSPPDPADRS